MRRLTAEDYAVDAVTMAKALVGAEAAAVGGAGPCGRGARGRDRAVQARRGGPRRQEGGASAGA